MFESPLWAQVSASLAYEAAGKRGDMSPTIRQLVPGVGLIGRAFTVKCLLGDFSAAARAVDEAQPGDVLVIDIGGTDRATGWGGTCSAYAKHRGIRGAVTNGSVRDLDEIRTLQFPVYAAGTSVRGGSRSHSGWTQVPVSVGDVVVNPGDIVIGDADGIVVIPARQEHEVAAQFSQLLAREARLSANVTTANSYLELVAK